jgi:hypothetical protein
VVQNWGELHRPRRSCAAQTSSFHEVRRTGDEGASGVGDVDAMAGENFARVPSPCESGEVVIEVEMMMRYALRTRSWQRGLLAETHQENRGSGMSRRSGSKATPAEDEPAGSCNSPIAVSRDQQVKQCREAPSEECTACAHRVGVVSMRRFLQTSIVGPTNRILVDN